MSTSVKGATTVLRVQGPGARFLGPRPRTVPSLVYIQVRSVNGEREAIELRIQAVLAVLECRYLGKEILNYFTFLKFNWLIKGTFLLFSCAQSCGTDLEIVYVLRRDALEITRSSSQNYMTDCHIAIEVPLK